MKLAVLFWFYKEPAICLNRLQLIRKYNPDLKIFGLFGGHKNQAKSYQSKLGAYLDKFYVSAYSSKPARWKWLNGDLMILDWYKNQGCRLKDWDSVVVIQWDALVLGDIKKQFPGLKKDEIFVSGTRLLDKYIERKWHWTKPEGKDRQNYLNFVRYLQTEYNYKRKLWCSLFILQVFPRLFFDKWLSVKDKEIGMLEYRIPTYARIFKVPFYKRDLGVRWFSKQANVGRTPLNAKGIEIRDEFIKSEFVKRQGYRLFHPYFKIW
jgi:hypothetical protein